MCVVLKSFSFFKLKVKVIAGVLDHSANWNDGGFYINFISVCLVTFEES